MRSALVTGANGFVGRVLCRQLQEAGFSVRALLRRDVEGPWDEAIHVDLRRGTIPATALERVDRVFHLAGVAHTQGLPDRIYQEVNVEGTRRLVEAAAKGRVERFVFFSSVKAVADPPESECVDERWTQQPHDAYGCSKREAEVVVLESARHSDMHAVVLRPTLVYGPGVKGNLRKIMQMIDSGFCPPLPDTHNRRSMVHVEDLCALALRVADTPVAAGKCYIVADGQPYTTRQLYEGILQALDRPVHSWAVPAGMLRLAGRMGDFGGSVLRRPLPVNSGMIARLLDSACYVAELCQRELAWRPQYDLLSSLPAMVAAWQKEINGKAQ